MVSQKALQKYCNLLLHNNSLYIIHNGRTWLTEKREVTQELIKKHLERQIIIGLQPQKEDGTVKWIAIDFDAHKDEPIQETKDNVIKTKENLSKVNIDSHIEKSGRGFHLWIFFNEPIARQKIEVLIKRFIYHSAEIYAGKTKIRIPLGSYQKDKTIFCGFLDNNFNLIEDQEQYLLNIKQTGLDIIKNADKTIRKDKSIITIRPILQNKKRKIVTEHKWIHIDRDKSTEKKPEINKKAVIKITENEKHKFILKLLFDLNLSPREIRNIKVKDVSINEQILKIGKTKVLLIPGHLINEFKIYLNDKQPSDFLLMSNRGKKYNLRTIEKIRQMNVDKIRLAPEK